MTANGTLPPPRVPGGRGPGSGGSRAGRLNRLSVLEERRWRVAEAKWAPYRDRLHTGFMFKGQCVKCFGWSDDPRHTTLRNVSLR